MFSSVSTLLVFFVVVGVRMGLSLEGIKLQSSQTDLLLSYMDFSVEPCDDFYEYACGNWYNVSFIPEDQQFWNPLLATELRELTEIRKVVEAPSDQQESGHAIHKAKEFYASCMNTTRIEELGEVPLLDFIERLGGWPAIDDNWTDNGRDWLNLLAETRRLDQRLIFDSFVFNDIFNKSQNSLYVQYSYVGLSSRHSFLNGGRELNAYKTLINDVLNALQQRDHSEAVKEIVDFETELAQIVLDGNELGKSLTESQIITTIGALQANFTSIDWMRYFTLVHNKTFKESDQVIVITLDYLKKLDDLIKRTPVTTRFNFLMWKIARLMAEFLGQRFESIVHNYNEEVNGVQKVTPVADKCVKKAVRYFVHAVGLSYIKNHFNETAREDAKALISRLKESYRQLIDNATWIDETSKVAALAKINKMGVETGYPDFVLDPAKVDEFYSTVDINRTAFFENLLSVHRLQNHLQTVQIGQAANSQMWPGSFLSMNAQYNYPMQTLFAAAPMFQPPMYHKDSNGFMNFGGIATILAHEISHGFDSIGIGFNADGEVKTWMSNSSMDLYKLRATCFADKYGNYSMNGTNFNGNHLLVEAIADDAGIKAAFIAYQSWLQENDDELPLKDERVDKYELSLQKMFFISSAQLNCMAVRPEAWPQLLKEESHAVRQFRVNGIMSNSKDFSQTFNCPAGSAMNPVKKCTIW